MCNMSLLNPFPRHIKVFYNNVQGLINTRDLASENPPLNMTKLHELYGFLFSNKPDILILNETSLKNPYMMMKFYPIATRLLDLIDPWPHILGIKTSQKI